MSFFFPISVWLTQAGSQLAATMKNTREMPAPFVPNRLWRFGTKRGWGVFSMAM